MPTPAPNRTVEAASRHGGLFWRLLACGVAAFLPMFVLGFRFNFVTVICGTITVLLALMAPPRGARTRDLPWVERAAFAAVLGLCLLLAAGRLLEPLWAWSPLPLHRDVLLSWLALATLAWAVPWTRPG